MHRLASARPYQLESSSRAVGAGAGELLLHPASAIVTAATNQAAFLEAFIKPMLASFDSPRPVFDKPRLAHDDVGCWNEPP